jgi:hypothetical protein
MPRECCAVFPSAAPRAHQKAGGRRQKPSDADALGRYPDSWVKIWRTAFPSLGGLSDLGRIGCKMTWPVHSSPLSCANRTTIRLKIVKLCPRPAHFSLRFPKSDRPLAKWLKMARVTHLPLRGQWLLRTTFPFNDLIRVAYVNQGQTRFPLGVSRRLSQGRPSLTPS